MIEALLPVACSILVVVGSLMCSRGTWFDSGVAPAIVQAQKMPLYIGWLCLACAGFGLMLTFRAEWLKTIQEHSAFVPWQVIATGIAFVVIGMCLTATGNTTDFITGEVVGSGLFIIGSLLIFHGTMTPEMLTKCQEFYRVPPSIATSSSITATATVATIPSTTTPTHTIPTPVTSSLPLADVSKIVWSAAKPKGVTFPPATTGRQWVIKHDVGGTAVVEFVVGTNFTSSDTLVNVRAYEVDMSDPTNPKPVHLATPITQKP